MSDDEVATPVEERDKEWFLQRGIDDDRVMDALDEIPRSPFVTMGAGEADSFPSKVLPPVEVVGKLLTALEVGGDDAVLEIGTDTGYITALLAELGDRVFTVERRLQIAKLAEGRFEEMGVDNAEILYGPRLSEYALNAPYDAILVSAVAPRIPEKLKERLAVGGRMVVSVGEGEDNPEVVCIRRVDDDEFERTSLGQLRFSSRLGEILVELGVADHDDVELAALEADARGQRIGEALLEHSQVQEQDLVRALAIQRGHKVSTVDRLLEMADHELAFSVPRAFLDHHQIIPLSVDGDTLSVATVDPDAPTVEVARILEADSVETYLVTSSQFQRIWDTVLEGRRPREAHEDTLKSRVEAKFDKILNVADKMGARTLHVDNQPEGGRVRFRVDDNLRTIPDLAFEPAEVDYLVEFLKLGAELDVLEDRLPQRGRFSWVRDDGRTDHMNVHVMPSVMGEQLSVQLLSHGAESPQLGDIGLSEELIKDLDVLLEDLHGLFLIVGPRHVGKRRTLYALLSKYAEDESRKVATVEEDVQTPIPDVQQVLTQPDEDFGYEKAIRELVQFHVDVLGIDEIPDPDVAMEALNAVRRGPTVLATLHGRDAAHVVDGLREFGLSPQVMAQGISGMLTQRRASAICPKCRREVEVDDQMIDELFDGQPPEDFKAYWGAGCGACDQTGTDGHYPLFELLPFNNRLRQAISAGESPAWIRKVAEQNGVETIADHAIRLVSEGKIPVNELRTHLPNDR